MAMMKAAPVNSPGPPPPGYAGGVGGGVRAQSQVVDVSAADEVVAVMATNGKRVKLSKEERDEQKKLKDRSALETKLHPALLAVFDCWSKASDTKSAPCTGIAQGKVKVQVWMNDNSTAAQQKLAAMGFAPIGFFRAGSPVTGTVSVDKLIEMANLQEVKLIALAK